MCDASKALALLDDLIKMLEAGSYTSSYESKMIETAKSAREAIEPMPHEMITITFDVTVPTLVGHYHRYIANREGISHRQMLTELLSYAYEQQYQHSVEVIEND